MSEAAVEGHYEGTTDCLLRRATPYDVPGIVSIGMRAMEDEPIKGLVIEPDKLRQVAIAVITDPASYAFVVEQDGVIVAALLAMVNEFEFYRRREAQVVQYYTIHPGQGIKLIRHFLRWVKGRRVIRYVSFTVDEGADPRIGQMLERMGLKPMSTIYGMVKDTRK